MAAVNIYLRHHNMLLLLNHRINQIDQIIISLLKFTNFDYKSLCIHVRLNGDSSNFLSVGSNLCCFKQWRAGKLPIKFFPEEKMQKSEERHVNNRIFICTYHLYTLFFTVNNACDKFLLPIYIPCYEVSLHDYSWRMSRKIT